MADRHWRTEEGRKSRRRRKSKPPGAAAGEFRNSMCTDKIINTRVSVLFEVTKVTDGKVDAFQLSG